MIEPIVFDISLSSLELAELWRSGAIYGLLLCISAFCSGFIINAVFGFMHDVVH